jgi:hypothetical protein
MTQAAPAALRLVCVSPVHRPPRPPFGLADWTPDATAVAVLLDATEADLEDAPSVAAQLPLATTLPPGTRVFVLGEATRTRAGLGRWLGPGTAGVARAPRCAALLARGYRDIAALVDDKTGADLVVGVSD